MFALNREDAPRATPPALRRAALAKIADTTGKRRGFFQNINAQQRTKTVKMPSMGMFRRYRKR
jgi:hypothetical protein